MAKRKAKSKQEAESVPFGSLAVGDHFQWAHHPDIMRKEAPEGPDNVSIVAGPRKGQSYHFAHWGRCRPCEGPGEAGPERMG